MKHLLKPSKFMKNSKYTLKIITKEKPAIYSVTKSGRSKANKKQIQVKHGPSHIMKKSLIYAAFHIALDHISNIWLLQNCKFSKKGRLILLAFSKELISFYNSKDCFQTTLILFVCLLK